MNKVRNIRKVNIGMNERNRSKPKSRNDKMRDSVLIDMEKLKIRFASYFAKWVLYISSNLFFNKKGTDYAYGKFKLAS